MLTTTLALQLPQQSESVCFAVINTFREQGLGYCGFAAPVEYSNYNIHPRPQWRSATPIVREPRLRTT